MRGWYRWLVVVGAVAGCDRRPLDLEEPATTSGPPMGATDAPAAMPEDSTRDHRCTQGRYTRNDDRQGGTELHIVGIHNTGIRQPAIGERIQGVVDIDVDRNTDVILMLASYSPVLWRVHPAPGTRVLKVMVTGQDRNRSTAEVPPGTVLETYSRQETGGVHSWQDEDHEAFMYKTQELAGGVKMSTFRGCSSSDYFRIGPEPHGLFPGHPDAPTP